MGWPHLAAVAYQAGDRLLICSDGLIDGVWERHIGNALGAAGSPSQATQTLMKRSLENSGVDDTTLIVIHIHQTAANIPTEENAHKVGTLGA